MYATAMFIEVAYIEQLILIRLFTTHAMHDSQPCVRYGRRILSLHILNKNRADKAYVKTVYL